LIERYPRVDRVTIQELHALAKQSRAASKYYDYHDPAFVLATDAGVVTVQLIDTPHARTRINLHPHSPDEFERAVFKNIGQLIS
jgi:hypothetical protein